MISTHQNKKKKRNPTYIFYWKIWNFRNFIIFYNALKTCVLYLYERTLRSSELETTVLTHLLSLNLNCFPARIFMLDRREKRETAGCAMDLFKMRIDPLTWGQDTGSGFPVALPLPAVMDERESRSILTPFRLYTGPASNPALRPVMEMAAAAVSREKRCRCFATTAQL